MSFPTRNGPFWGALGVPPFKETPIFETTTVTVVLCSCYLPKLFEFFFTIWLRIEQMENGWLTFMSLLKKTVE